MHVCTCHQVHLALLFALQTKYAADAVLLVGLLQRLRFCRLAHPGVAATQWQTK
jgi:hypothetical protein